MMKISWILALSIYGMMLIPEAWALPEEYAPENFVGDIVEVESVYGTKLNAIDLRLTMPPHHELLFDANPSMRVFNEDSSFDREYPITRLNEVFLLEKLVETDKLFVHLSLYYCKTGETGLCLFKDVLYIVPLEESGIYDQILISYQVPSGDY